MEDKGINFKKNAWHANLYRIYWGKEPGDNGCPYFWRWMFMIPTIGPMFALSIPEFILAWFKVGAYSPDVWAFTEEEGHTSRPAEFLESFTIRGRRDEFWVPRVFGNLIIWILGYAFTVGPYQMLTTSGWILNPDLLGIAGKFVYVVLLMVLFVVACLMLGFVWDLWKEHRRTKKYGGKQETSFYEGMKDSFSAWYEKHCPRINWID